MFAQLKTVVLIREAIKLAFLWASWLSGASAFVGLIILWKWPEKDNFLLKLDSLFLFWEMKAIPCEKLPRNWRFPTTGVYYFLQRTALMGSNQNRKRSGRPRCKRTSISEFLVWEIDASQVLNWAASLNGTRKTSVSTSTVKRWLWDAGLLGRMAKKKPYLRLANKRKRLRWAKEHRHWTEEDWKKSVMDRQM